MFATPPNTMNNKKLIEQLVADGYLKTPIIIEAFQRIDRADFVPDNMKQATYINHALPIGHEQTISQPLTVAFMLELLEPKTGEKILDIGTGSGWQAALLAYIVSKNDTENKGKIITIERIPELKKFAEKNLEKYTFLDKGRIQTVLGDGSRGYKTQSPFDKIVAAAAASKLPPKWKEQLSVGGRIVTPIGQSIYTFDRVGENEFTTKQYFGFSFVPLVTEL